MTRIDAVVVAIPARNEALRLPTALAAVAAAALVCPVPVVVVVAADVCTDATPLIAADAGAVVVRSDAARVGGARAAAVRTGLAALGAPGRVWIANTDADSAVPADWLTVHLEYAEHGVVLLRGSVVPELTELTSMQLEAWMALNPRADPHEYVHGANLGVTGDAYLAAGGFPDVAVHEDVALVRAVEASGRATSSTDRAPVTTSARLVGRAEGGFATYLRDHVPPAG